MYGSRILDEETSLVTSFTPDEYGREHYWVSVGLVRASRSHLKDIVDAIVRIETYYHLLLMQKPLFSAAIDQAYKFEQVYLKQRAIITEHIGHADSQTLQRWLNGLPQDLLKTTRLSGRLHCELSSSLPYDKIVQQTLASLKERLLPLYRPMSDFVFSGIIGVAEGYQQPLKRIDTLLSGFEGIISIIRARVDLMMQSQNLTLLSSADKTTKSPAILQHTVEGLLAIVITTISAGWPAMSLRGSTRWGGSVTRRLPLPCLCRSRSVSHSSLRASAENTFMRNSQENPRLRRQRSLRIEGQSGELTQGDRCVTAHFMLVSGQ